MTDDELKAMRAKWEQMPFQHWRVEVLALLDAVDELEAKLVIARMAADLSRETIDAVTGALRDALGAGHNLKAFAGTMLRWKEPGVDFSDEARRIVDHAERWHVAVVAALALLEKARALAPLPPTLVVVPVDVLDAARAVLDGTDTDTALDVLELALARMDTAR